MYKNANNSLSFCSAKWNSFSNFGKGSLEKHFCEIILNSGHLPRRRCCFKVFSVFSSGGHFVHVQQNGNILAILIKVYYYKKEQFCKIILKSGGLPRISLGQYSDSFHWLVMMSLII